METTSRAVSIPVLDPDSAAKRCRLHNGSQLLTDVIQGVIFQDGLRLQAAA